MAIAATNASLSRPFSHWSVAGLWLVGLIAYGVLVWLLDDVTTRAVNDGAWTLASAAAAWSCFITARQLPSSSARAWWLFGTGCLCWFIGQLLWNYNRWMLGIDMPFESIGQIFYLLFPLLAIGAISQLPESHHGSPIMPKQLGNVALVLCCLAVTVVLGLIEPAIQSNVPRYYLWLGGGRSVFVAATFLYALYTLWTYRWSAMWTVVLKIVVAAGVYAVGNLIYLHALFTRTYLPDDLINVSWLLVFAFLSWAAVERHWSHLNPRELPPARLLMQERWIEAVIPALLIIIMVIVAVSSHATLTTRVLTWTAVLFIIFAIVLGVREALVQNDTQRLNNDLMDSNRRLNEANADLRESEKRYRDLNTVLEKRVAERTAQLERAYGELEGFSYAVAHDLKSPLRAIDGFAHLLREEVNDMSPQGDAHLRRIRSGVLRMSSLIDDLLSYASIERRDLHATDVDVPELVQSVLEGCAEEIQRRNIKVELEIEPLIVFLDAEGLALAVRNLIGNAIKYSTSVESPTLTVRAVRTEHGARLTVADNGIGFDMQYHDTIFKIFQRLHREDQYPGTGIGLALVRKAVERIGGRVWAESAIGRGATFFIELPQRVIRS
ncbi:signal transduction histidine kinase [Povalibacter uvarum]|uniref:histidine kinase n=1 Tax=Povalibacter uvarum TaxID=732238 RepID=A0A841HLG8_9GAMM|nr:ATP-binding protein [Povalibacter uvarum]MBB6093209.1 signal transduction histidine kinase [Povalibacter uvarum]